jgi:ribonucleoside-diphosphate reductase alpha chain
MQNQTEIKDKQIVSQISQNIKNLQKLVSVVKRNGRIVPFHKERVQNAIEAAFRDVRGIKAPEALPSDIMESIVEITESVCLEALTLGQKGVTLTVEGIQDLVEITLMKHGHHDVARGYIIYRQEHEKQREDAGYNIKVFRSEEGPAARFNPMKISSAIERLFRHFEAIESDNLPVETINTLTKAVIEEVKAKSEPLYVSDIQDLIEQVLMKAGLFEMAKYYILHRVGKSDELKPKAKLVNETTFGAKTTEGKEIQVTKSKLLKRAQHATRNLPKIDVEEFVNDTIKNFYEGIKESEIDQAMIMTARSKIEKNPAFIKVASRLLLDTIYQEILQTSFLDPDLKNIHKAYFKEYLKKGIQIERVSAELLNFDLNAIAEALNLDRDDDFTYLGLQTLYDRYFLHDEGKRFETPQIFWMRVAMGLSIKEKDKTQKAIEFYNQLSEFYSTSATPTLFNAGTPHSQLSSCYLLTVSDDLHHIFKTIADDAQLSKWAGGIGNDWTNVRATGSRIHGTNGKSQGIIPFLKVANDTAVAVNQGGKRKGAMCAYLETWHLDIEDFLELRKNTGDERRRTHDMNTANWIPDLFMKRVQEGGKWTLFSPSTTPDLHSLYGKAFEKRYTEYERLAEEGKIALYKTVDATTLWRKMLSMLFETGHPWITFKDAANVRSPQDHVGVINSSNLCTEIFLNTSETETAVCNLASVNLSKHVTKNGIDEERLKETVKTAIRMLDNVIDINFYPTQEAKNANTLHRPIGLGIMGFQDALCIMGISYASHEAVEFADEISEMIAYYAILASTELAKERGTYASYIGSKWDRGILPIDTLDILEKERGAAIEVSRKTRMDWSKVREAVKAHGMRNSNTMAIAPTATIANIAGVASSIEPNYKNLYVKSNLSGEFTIVNHQLISDLEELNLWDDDMLDDLKYYDGSILEIDRIPDHIKQRYLTAFEIDPDWLIECAGRRQKWIDMGQSLNLYLAEPSGKKLHEMYFLAWKNGLKSTYYLRSLSATQIEKSSVDINKHGLQPRWMKNKSASSNITVDRAPMKEGAVCSMEEGCESCQ